MYIHLTRLKININIPINNKIWQISINYQPPRVDYISTTYDTIIQIYIMKLSIYKVMTMETNLQEINTTKACYEMKIRRQKKYYYEEKATHGGGNKVNDDEGTQ